MAEIAIFRHRVRTRFEWADQPQSVARRWRASVSPQARGEIAGMAEGVPR